MEGVGSEGRRVARSKWFVWSLQLTRSADGFSVVADYFGRGVFNKVKYLQIICTVDIFNFISVLYFAVVCLS